MSTSASVSSWLEENRLSRYIESFEEQGYDDLDVLKTLNMHERCILFQSCRISPGHQAKINRLLENEDNSSNSALSSSSTRRLSSSMYHSQPKLPDLLGNAPYAIVPVAGWDEGEGMAVLVRTTDLEQMNVDTKRKSSNNYRNNDNNDNEDGVGEYQDTTHTRHSSISSVGSQFSLVSGQFLSSAGEGEGEGEREDDGEHNSTNPRNRGLSTSSFGMWDQDDHPDDDSDSDPVVPHSRRRAGAGIAAGPGGGGGGGGRGGKGALDVLTEATEEEEQEAAAVAAAINSKPPPPKKPKPSAQQNNMQAKNINNNNTTNKNDNSNNNNNHHNNNKKNSAGEIQESKNPFAESPSTRNTNPFAHETDTHTLHTSSRQNPFADNSPSSTNTKSPNNPFTDASDGFPMVQRSRSSNNAIVAPHRERQPSEVASDSLAAFLGDAEDEEDDVGDENSVKNKSRQDQKNTQQSDSYADANPFTNAQPRQRPSFRERKGHKLLMSECSFEDMLAMSASETPKLSVSVNNSSNKRHSLLQRANNNSNSNNDDKDKDNHNSDAADDDLLDNDCLEVIKEDLSFATNFSHQWHTIANQIQSGLYMIKRLRLYLERICSVLSQQGKLLRDCTINEETKGEKVQNDAMRDFVEMYKQCQSDMKTLAICQHTFVTAATTTVVEPLRVLHDSLEKELQLLLTEHQRLNKQFRQINTNLRKERNECYKLYETLCHERLLVKKEKKEEAQRRKKEKEAMVNGTDSSSSSGLFGRLLNRRSDHSEQLLETEKKVKERFGKFDRMVERANASKDRFMRQLLPDLLTRMETLELRRLATFEALVKDYVALRGQFLNPITHSHGLLSEQLGVLDSQASLHHWARTLLDQVGPAPFVTPFVNDLPSLETEEEKKEREKLEERKSRPPCLACVTATVDYSNNKDDDMDITVGKLIIMYSKIGNYVVGSKIDPAGCQTAMHGQDQKVASSKVELTPVTEDVSLAQFIQWKPALDLLTRHCEKEYSPENLKFWRAVRKFRATYGECRDLEDPDDGKYAATLSLRKGGSTPASLEQHGGYTSMIEYARALAKDYIGDEAPWEVNISSTLVDDIHQALEVNQVTSSIFNPAQVEIFRMISFDSFARFKNTTEFEQYLEEWDEPWQSL